MTGRKRGRNETKERTFDKTYGAYDTMWIYMKEMEGLTSHRWKGGGGSLLSVLLMSLCSLGKDWSLREGRVCYCVIWHSGDE